MDPRTARLTQVRCGVMCSGPFGAKNQLFMSAMVPILHQPLGEAWGWCVCTEGRALTHITFIRTLPEVERYLWKLCLRKVCISSVKPGFWRTFSMTWLQWKCLFVPAVIAGKKEICPWDYQKPFPPVRGNQTYVLVNLYLSTETWHRGYQADGVWGKEKRALWISSSSELSSLSWSYSEVPRRERSDGWFREDWIRNNWKWKRWVTEDKNQSIVSFPGRSGGGPGVQGLVFHREQDWFKEDLQAFPGNDIDWCWNR